MDDDDDDDFRREKAKPSANNNKTRVAAPVLLDEDDDDNNVKDASKKRARVSDVSKEDLLEEKPRSDGKSSLERDLADENKWRDSLREIQNTGYDAYVGGNYDRAKEKFERALSIHQSRCKRNADLFEASGNRVPSRIHAERDGVRCKLLKYLAKVLEKLGEADSLKARMEEA